MQMIRCTIDEDTQEIVRTFGPVYTGSIARHIENTHRSVSGNKGAEAWDCTYTMHDGRTYLVRWDHCDDEYIQPDTYVPALEAWEPADYTEAEYDAMYLAGEIDER